MHWSGFCRNRPCGGEHCVDHLRLLCGDIAAYAWKLCIEGCVEERAVWSELRPDTTCYTCCDRVEECWIVTACDCVVEYICCVWNFFCLASHECDVYTALKTDILVRVGDWCMLETAEDCPHSRWRLLSKYQRGSLPKWPIASKRFFSFVLIIFRGYGALILVHADCWKPIEDWAVYCVSLNLAITYLVCSVI